MFKKTVVAVLSLTSVWAFAQTPNTAVNQSVSTVFDQQVFYTIPSGFSDQLINERANETNYIHERVLTGENAQNWSQVITVTGLKGLASNPKVTPMVLIGSIVMDFKKACPNSFSGTKFFEGNTGNGMPVSVAVLSCGTFKDKSETTLIAAMKGANDYYTVQWAEHGKASKKPLTIDEQKWIARLNALAPGVRDLPKAAPAKKAKR